MGSAGSWRLWLFRGLVLGACIMVIISAVLPWWSAVVSHYDSGTWRITIYQYGIPRGAAPLDIATDLTPVYQIVLAWVYVAASAGLMLWSTWLKGKKAQLLLAAIGLSFALYAAVAAYIVIAHRVADFGGQLVGVSAIRIPQQDISDVPLNMTSKLRAGYYLAYIAGGFTVVLALLRNVITGSSGEPKNVKEP
jgi:hypothetical protein